MSRRISEERRRIAVEMYQTGLSVDRVAALMQMGQATVRRVAKEAGVLRRQGRPIVDDTPLPEVARLYDRFKREEDVALILGISRSAVHYRLVRARRQVQP